MKKNILIYRYNSICEPLVISAFKAIGVHVDEITEAMTNKKMSTKDEMMLVSKSLVIGKQLLEVHSPVAAVVAGHSTTLLGELTVVGVHNTQ